jgi:hypothetical protein
MMYKNGIPHSLIKADTKPQLEKKIRRAYVKQGLVPSGKPQRYADHKVKGWYQVMVPAQLALFGSN